MTATNDYSEYIERTVPKNEQLAHLDRLVDDAAKKDAEIGRLTDQLEQLKKQLTQVTEHDIPDLLTEMGLEEITTSDGLHVKINKLIETSIPKDNEQKAFQWLRDNNCAALLKTEVKVLFGMDDDEKAVDLVGYLDGRYANVSNKTTIHPSTLKAFGRERLSNGESLPTDIFKVYEGRIAKITRKK